MKVQHSVDFGLIKLTAAVFCPVLWLVCYIRGAEKGRSRHMSWRREDRNFESSDNYYSAQVNEQWHRDRTQTYAYIHTYIDK